jgi:hypothetical protein
MILYLVTGVPGLVVLIVKAMSRLGWLEPAVRSVFGGYADGVLENLDGMDILATFVLAPVIPALLIAALLIVFRYRQSWELVAPAAILLLAGLTFFATVWMKRYDDSVFVVTITVLCALYGLSASIVGLRWLIRRT